MGRFSLGYVSQILSEILDERGVKVGAVVSVRGSDVVLLDGSGIGALSRVDLYALASLITERVIELEYGS